MELTSDSTTHSIVYSPKAQSHLREKRWNQSISSQNVIPKAPKYTKIQRHLLLCILTCVDANLLVGTANCNNVPFTIMTPTFTNTKPFVKHAQPNLLHSIPCRCMNDELQTYFLKQYLNIKQHRSRCCTQSTASKNGQHLEHNDDIVHCGNKHYTCLLISKQLPHSV